VVVHTRRASADIGERDMRVLLVEDDAELARTVAAGLKERGWEVELAADYQEGRRRAALGSYGVIVLDIMLPGGSGIELCQRIRAGGNATPVLMLTARDAVDDKVKGLEAGADDYLAKPFAFRELVARIEALARRQPALTPEVARIGDLEVELKTHRVRRAGKEIALTAREFDLLEFFVKHQGQVVDRAAITAHVWDENHDPFTNALEVLVRRLRVKIDEPFEPKLIQTLRGSGYRFGLP
jgi:two-component system copper resistance phosphate regulon response regulator CusR